MNPFALMVCHSLLANCEPQQRQKLVHFLPEKSQLSFKILPKFSLSKQKRSTYADILHQMHHSWFAPYLRSLAESDIRLFISALSKEQQTGLKKQLLLADHLPKLSEDAKEFALETLFKNLPEIPVGLLPPSFLPDSSLNILLSLKDSDLKDLAIFLGLHDLSFEMKQIIDTAKLKVIYQALTEKQQKFLNSFLTQKEPLVVKRLFLQNWDGNRSSLQALLQQSGFLRLGKAFSGEDQNFIWYISHHLEMSSASLVLQASTPMESDKILHHLKEQILSAVKILKVGQL